MPYDPVTFLALVHEIQSNTDTIVEQLEEKIEEAGDATHIEIAVAGLEVIKIQLGVYKSAFAKLVEHQQQMDDMLDRLHQRFTP